MPTDLSEVKVGVFLVDIAEVDDVKQQVYVDLYGIAEWHDKRLANCHSIDLATLWHPQIDLVNQRDVNKISQLTLLTEGTKVRARQRFNGWIAVPLNLHEFPNDQQNIYIELVLLEQAENLKLIGDSNLSGKRGVFTLAGWQIGESNITTNLATGLDNQKFSVAKFSLVAKRELNYYTWKVILPLMVIVIMSWSVFWILPEHVAPKIGVSTTAVLTLFAFQLSLSDVLPRIAYLTRMDIFVLGAFVMVLLGLIESLVSVRLAGSGKMARANMLDKRCRLIFPLLFVPIIVSAFWL